MSDNLHEIYIQRNNPTAQLLTNNDYKQFNNHWTGKVIDDNDPIHLGRVKIRINGYYSEIANAAIPWALPESTYLGSKKGTLIIPKIGTLVRGYFDNGDDQKPIYTSLAPNENNYATSDMLTHSEEISDYPNILVLLTTDEGERVTLNRASGEMKFVHRSGTTINIASDGSIQITTVNTQQVGGSVSSDAPGTDITIAGKINVISEGGGIDITSKMSNININSQGGSINLGSNACDKVDPNTGEVTVSTTKHPINNFTNCLFTGAPHCAPDTLAASLGELKVYV